MKTTVKFLLVAAWVSLAIGCDSRPKRAQISGKVLIDGEPVPTGMIQFIPEGTRPSVGAIKDDGSFVMACYEKDDGVILGTHAVTIIASEVLSSSKIKWYAPKKYANAETSELSFTVEETRDDVVFELTWDGGKPFIEKTSRRAVEEVSEDI